MTSSIPADRQPAVRRALMSAFGTETCDSVVRLTGGLSGAGVFRIRVGGIAYLLRIEAADGGMFAPELWYPAMRIAAEAALAPRLVYADAADGVSICDYLEPRSLAQDYPGDREALLTELGQLLRHLHAAAPFPAHADYLGVLGILTDQFAAVAGPIPALAAGREAIAAYATLEPELVSSHNDLNPRNLLFDGRRIWLVDWQAAFLADRYMDLASLANMFAGDPASEESLLKAYFGASPDPRQRARLGLARLVNHLFYGLMFLRMSGGAAPSGSRDLAAAHAAIGEGALNIDSPAGQAEYGRARFAALAEGVASPAFRANQQLAAGSVVQ